MTTQIPECAKHTPGPWSWSAEPQPNGCPIVGSRGLMVAMLAHTVNAAEQREEAIANARLIAAAPDLLSELKRMLVFADAWVRAQAHEDEKEAPGTTFPGTRAVIALAEGKL